MEVSASAKARFCKDCNIPLTLFQEPYFMDRVNLYDRFYRTIDKWNLFVYELQKYHCEQDYFEEYNKIKDEAISSIKESAAYKSFDQCDFGVYKVDQMGIPSKDIFKDTNDGKVFCSIDMKKANFSALRCYDESIFSGSTTWEEFIGKFTNNKHIINSKYIRQVILGNCNPKRHITYEKHLMGEVLRFLTEFLIPIDKAVFFSNDEIVYDITDVQHNMEFFFRLQDLLDEEGIVPLKVECFKLHKILNTDGYYKEILKSTGETEIEFKCLNNYMLPFVIRRFVGEEITESDKVFYHEGYLAKFVEIPKIVLT